jgi:hypothetical protein
MKKFFEEIEQLLYLIRNYGVDNYIKEGGSKDEINPYELCKFSNFGFKKAQLKVLELLLKEAEVKKKIKKNLTEERSKKTKDKVKIRQIQTDLKLSEMEEGLLRHVIDSIAWQLYGGKREMIGRYYMEEEGTSSITDEGFEATLALANKINADPTKFALITDLTENIQIGDLHVWSPEGIDVIEVKTGEKNRIAIELFGFYDTNNLNPTECIEKIDDAKMRKQMQRMQNQKEKMKKTEEILNKDSGEYQKNPESRVEIHDSHFQQETYHGKILDLIEKSKEKGWAYESIGAIVNVGVYRDKWRFGTGKETLIKCNKGYQVVDIRECTGFTIGEPLFCKPFSDEIIMDIIKGNIIIYIGVDLQHVIDFGNDLGGSMRWSTKKELHEMKTNSPLKGREIISHNNTGVIMGESKNGKAFMAGGFICRLVFDHLHPWIEIANRVHTYQNEIEE